jgi:hypothetical protein
MGLTSDRHPGVSRDVRDRLAGRRCPGLRARSQRISGGWGSSSLMIELRRCSHWCRCCRHWASRRHSRSSGSILMMMPQSIINHRIWGRHVAGQSRSVSARFICHRIYSSCRRQSCRTCRWRCEWPRYHGTRSCGRSCESSCRDGLLLLMVVVSGSCWHVRVHSATYSCRRDYSRGRRWWRVVRRWGCWWGWMLGADWAAVIDDWAAADEVIVTADRGTSWGGWRCRKQCWCCWRITTCK